MCSNICCSRNLTYHDHHHQWIMETYKTELATIQQLSGFKNKFLCILPGLIQQGAPQRTEHSGNIPDKTSEKCKAEIILCWKQSAT